MPICLNFSVSLAPLVSPGPEEYVFERWKPRRNSLAPTLLSSGLCLTAPFAFQICNMPNARRMNTSAVSGEHPSPHTPTAVRCREQWADCFPARPEAPGSGVTRKHAQGLCPAHPGWPPHSRFFRQKRREGEEKVGVREGGREFVTLAWWGWWGDGQGDCHCSVSSHSWSSTAWAQHSCSVNGLA